MKHSEIGKIVLEEWERTNELRSTVLLDAFVVMPNHVHGIVRIEYPPAVGRQRAAPLRPDSALFREVQQKLGTSRDRISNSSRLVRPGSLGAVVRGFKSAVTKRVNESRNTPSNPVWQKNYHDRVIRNARELNAVREYIVQNPTNWSRDLETKSDLEWYGSAFSRLAVLA